jgi:hypothetical protein
MTDDNDDEYKDDMKETDPKFHAAVGKRYGADDEDSRIGFEEWNLFDVHDMAQVMESLIKKGLKAGFKLAEEQYECHAWFTAEYSNTPSGTIAVELPLGPHDSTGPTWTFELSELVDSLIESHKEALDEPDYEEEKQKLDKLLAAVRDEFRSLADTLDTQLKGEAHVEE